MAEKKKGSSHAPGFLWVTTHSFRRLHAALDSPAVQQMRDGDEKVYHGACVHLSCGEVLDCVLPSRYAWVFMERCSHCCRAVGVSTGHGLPETRHFADHYGWLVAEKTWDRLHCAATPEGAANVYQNDHPHNIQTRLTCGITTGCSMPGIFFRLGLKRCSHCCRILGISGGLGTPRNESAQREEYGNEKYKDLAK